MALKETTNGDPICEICGNSGYAVTMLLYSGQQKSASEEADKKQSYYVCSECQKHAKDRGWRFVR